KGGFLRTLAHAKELYASIPEADRSRTEAIALMETIEKYESLVSTAPSEYEKATLALEEAMEDAASLSAVGQIASGSELLSREYFNIHGQSVNAAEKGLLIERIRYADGTVVTLKKMN
ncbi:MAG: hypothetical protein K2J46_06690, partial [Muribaculaceae bacterium]|nr:hypothetical protein [Muribaculaceae bacterium]